MNIDIAKLVQLVVGLVMSVSCLAVDITTSNGFHIVANTISVDINKGISTYEGDVTVTQNSMIFDADKVTVYESNKTLTSLIATGSPAVFINTLATSEDIAKGEAGQLEYTANDNKILLESYSLIDGSGNKTNGRYGRYVLRE